MLTLSVVIVPNQNWSPDHTIQSELLGFLTLLYEDIRPTLLTILTQTWCCCCAQTIQSNLAGFLLHQLG